MSAAQRPVLSKVKPKFRTPPPLKIRGGVTRCLSEKNQTHRRPNAWASPWPPRAEAEKKVQQQTLRASDIPIM